MAKKSPKRKDEDEVQKLTTQVGKLRARLKEAEARTAKWKAEARRLEAEAVKRTKQVKKLRRAQTRPKEEVEAQSPAAVLDETWTVTRLRESARAAGVRGYSRMTKAALLDSLSRSE